MTAYFTLWFQFSLMSYLPRMKKEGKTQTNKQTNKQRTYSMKLIPSWEAKIPSAA